MHMQTHPEDKHMAMDMQCMRCARAHCMLCTVVIAGAGRAMARDEREQSGDHSTFRFAKLTLGKFPDFTSVVPSTNCYVIVVQHV